MLFFFSSSPCSLFSPLQRLVDQVTYSRVLLGRIPMMLKSMYCWTKDLPEADLSDVGECAYDQGGYFIINGGEKVTHNCSSLLPWLFLPSKETTQCACPLACHGYIHTCMYTHSYICIRVSVNIMSVRRSCGGLGSPGCSGVTIISFPLVTSSRFSRPPR